ncbi:AraC family transcriptional regulator [Arcticibacter tournemirensis]|uniref:Helix-turn-helix domain-containing protein n=1 Tax=Arcticibacter tournemirensis TaxID=699437 RepID=A0A4Q0MGB9_9SPHI|nr:helix-turn-helix domain-containing protein [Arcticibacter tournemirensis]RXF72414.1 helix-turn-helix domain-containing protein [Arcticibacter tournemirensis]
MKVLQFTIPVAHDKSVIVQQDHLPHFYPYLHRHTEAQIAWIQEGEGTLVVGNNMHSFKSGEVYFLGPNQPHLFKSNPEYFTEGNGKTIKALMLFFNPMGPLASLFGLPEMKSLKFFIDQHAQGFKLPSMYYDDVSQLMLEIKESSGPDQLMQFFLLLKFMNKMRIKLNPLSSFGHATTFSENEGIRISNIYNYILQRYHEDITLEDVANAAHMTPQAFCRYFKKHTGHTFISFLNETRINEACKKLTGGRFDSISAVAYTCGFNSITNFNRVFKSIIGNSPREYLDNYLKNVG